MESFVICTFLCSFTLLICNSNTSQVVLANDNIYQLLETIVLIEKGT